MVTIIAGPEQHTGRSVGSIVRRVRGRHAKLRANADPNLRGWADVVGPLNPDEGGRRVYAQIYASAEAWETATEDDFV